MKIEVSIGEIVDKLSILQIKKDLISDSDKLNNVKNEFNYLHDIVFNELKVDMDDYNNLLIINQILWGVEDAIREKEKSKLFDKEFIELARKVYITNDKRSKIKKDLNLKYKSFFVEEKSYK